MSTPENEPSDERLVQDSLAGNDESFAMLVRRHRGRVFRLAARFARDDHELDDIAQEVFIKVFRHLGTFRADAPIEHWLARIATRTCYDHLRRRRHADVPFEDIEVSVKDDLAPARAKDILDAALVQLSADERLVITLLELEEKSVREIAELTGWSEGNVKVRVFRARQKLKAVLEKNHER